MSEATTPEQPQEIPEPTQRDSRTLVMSDDKAPLPVSDAIERATRGSAVSPMPLLPDEIPKFDSEVRVNGDTSNLEEPGLHPSLNSPMIELEEVEQQITSDAILAGGNESEDIVMNDADTRDRNQDTNNGPVSVSEDNDIAMSDNQTNVFNSSKDVIEVEKGDMNSTEDAPEELSTITKDVKELVTEVSVCASKEIATKATAENSKNTERVADESKDAEMEDEIAVDFVTSDLSPLVGTAAESVITPAKHNPSIPGEIKDVSPNGTTENQGARFRNTEGNTPVERVDKAPSDRTSEAMCTQDTDKVTDVSGPAQTELFEAKIEADGKPEPSSQSAPRPKVTLPTASDKEYIRQLPSIASYSTENTSAFPQLDNVVSKLIATYLKSYLEIEFFTEDALTHLSCLATSYLSLLVGKLHNITEYQRRHNPAIQDLYLMFRLENSNVEADSFKCGLVREYDEYQKFMSPDDKVANPKRTAMVKYYSELAQESTALVRSYFHNAAGSNILEQEVSESDPSAPFFNNAYSFAISDLVHPSDNNTSLETSTHGANGYVPLWLPFFPPRHTYRSTPTYVERLTDMRELKVKLVDESRLVEGALMSLLLKQEQKEAVLEVVAASEESGDEASDVDAQFDKVLVVNSPATSENEGVVIEEAGIKLGEAVEFPISLELAKTEAHVVSEVSNGKENSVKLETTFPASASSASQSKEFDILKYAEKRLRSLNKRRIAALSDQSEEFGNTANEDKDAVFRKLERLLSPYAKIPGPHVEAEPIGDIVAGIMSSEYKMVLEQVSFAEHLKRRKLAKQAKKAAELVKQKEQIEQDQRDNFAKYNQENDANDDVNGFDLNLEFDPSDAAPGSEEEEDDNLRATLIGRTNPNEDGIPLSDEEGGPSQPQRSFSPGSGSTKVGGDNSGILEDESGGELVVPQEEQSESVVEAAPSPVVSVSQEADSGEDRDMILLEEV
ncbi:hypothetical protein BABINDRAFT_159546 [Babjeviella inositovora NRRL Y-12698]|uniref:Transcription initiation factor TFIID subunit 8 n=1 Tax=Babjeviella inositovora NRRL Y-12698 TaxID=984486 RepID=A0A1E3QZS2_9ASCO|nr:uncharacterized protein BABINDRAFT_159546 [Babjeviella inositovora NRRL Y-12698]ODQ83085.1 hypothetical protein BABINDRAFT_159546 [Babjeviella inositovora NRRL Y-12698]